MANDWHPHAFQALQVGDYAQVARIYEQAIQEQPEQVSHYWYLGLTYLLQGHEEDAQATWLAPTLEGNDQELELWFTDLQQILNVEAQRQASLGNSQLSWLIRGHLRELAPADVDNLLKFLQLSLVTDNFSSSLLSAWSVSEALQHAASEQIDLTQLTTVLQQVVNFALEHSYDIDDLITFCEASVSCFPHPTELIPVLIDLSHTAFYKQYQRNFGLQLAKLCLKIDPNNLLVLQQLTYLHIHAGKMSAAVEFAQQYCQVSLIPSDRALGSLMLLQTLLATGGRWPEVIKTYQNQKLQLQQLIAEQNLNTKSAFSILNAPFLFNYIDDDPLENRVLQNQVAHLCQSSLAKEKPLYRPANKANLNQQNIFDRKLKIGYICHHFREHSVGFLSRWIFQHYNRDKYHVSLYLFNQSITEFTQQWFIETVDAYQQIETSDPNQAAELIANDNIDILIDLDSVTQPNICCVMAHKPAPVQATWLGCDASGIPHVDYFIADRYVLPENAEEYYHEKIVRLPHTYLAINGFEVGVPTLRREHLDIPSDAVVYLSVQTGLKRNPDLARLQLQILKQVPNSYFLIKGYADDQAVQEAFTQVAQAEGIDSKHLRFLKPDPTELIHRANLQIADVVLDTYPYNGATTTMEVLWMGIPLVTRVGQQFAARNSYTFLINAGITEGIAWSNDEYIDWGVRYGTDASLRQQVSWKLKLSRRTAPLWNAKQFTRDLEQAYQQMYLQTMD
jgi:predicted O-linked N-acetylglucosamine transferase (SPINDLY family)